MYAIGNKMAENLPIRKCHLSFFGSQSPIFLEKFLQERVFSKVISIYAPVPLNKRLTFANIPIVENQGEELKARAFDMKRSALKFSGNLAG